MNNNNERIVKEVKKIEEQYVIYTWISLIPLWMINFVVTKETTWITAFFVTVIVATIIVTALTVISDIASGKIEDGLYLGTNIEEGKEYRLKERGVCKLIYITRFFGREMFLLKDVNVQKKYFLNKTELYEEEIKPL